MGQDAECVEHDWELEEVIAGSDGADMVSTCARCGVVGYEESVARRDQLKGLR